MGQVPNFKKTKNGNYELSIYGRKIVFSGSEDGMTIKMSGRGSKTSKIEINRDYRFEELWDSLKGLSVYT